MDHQDYEPQQDTYKPPKLDGRMYKLGKRELALIGITVVLVGVIGWYAWQKSRSAGIHSFEECVAAGNPVMESYPEQCAANGQTFSNTSQQGTQAQESSDSKDTVLMTGPGTYESAGKLYALDVPQGWQVAAANSENPNEAVIFSDKTGACDAEIRLTLSDAAQVPSESFEEAENKTLQNIRNIASDAEVNGYKSYTVSDVILSNKHGVYSVGISNGSTGRWVDEEVRKYVAYINKETILEFAYVRQPVLPLLIPTE